MRTLTGEFDSLVEFNSNLNISEGYYSVVLPVCKVCLENGCNIIVRVARQNTKAKQAKIEAAATREAGRQVREDEAAAIAGAIVAATTIASNPAATPATTSAPKANSRKRIRRVCVYLVLLPHLLLLNFVASLYKQLMGEIACMLLAYNDRGCAYYTLQVRKARRRDQTRALIYNNSKVKHFYKLGPHCIICSKVLGCGIPPLLSRSGQELGAR